ncbi:MAG: phosphopantetheine-binding protein [Ruminococcus flavefaciens]|nr:phosphopantetheine-binding protein [Ruminococcus flavefaciens]
MTEQEKLTILEEMMEVENKLTTNTILSELEEWDSMAQLSFIVLMEDDFRKKIKRSDIMNFKTIQDIIDIMN